MSPRLRLTRVTEYQVVSSRCGGYGHVSEPTATDVPRPLTPETTAPAPDAATELNQLREHYLAAD
jgi:hypothetical protein